MAVYLADGINQKMVTAAVLDTLKSVNDFVSYHRSDVVFDLNAANTNTAVVRVEPTVALVDTVAAADRTDLTPRSTASSTKVEVTLTTDKLFHVAIDPMDVSPGTQSTELGRAGGKSIAQHSNAVLLAAAVADGTENFLGETFGSGTTGTEAWDKLVDLYTAFQEAELTEDSTLYIAPAFYNTVVKDVATLRVGIDPRVQAATILGAKRVVVTPITGALAIAAHTSGLVGARRIASIRKTDGPVDTTITGRIKCGAKVLDADAVQVLVDGDGS